jgi:DNA (cytosine-5)-methyltransferase 1
MTLTVGSLFAGIGGFDLGLERAGMRVIWQSEIDPYASAVLRKHWPEVPNVGDIRSIRAGTVERPDVLCGGFPCQPFSHAGKQRGADDDRHLWPEMCRVIGDLRPAWVLGENVAGIIRMELDQVLFDLDALGYATRVFAIPAAGVDAPHRRERIWIVSCDRDRDRESTLPVDAEVAGLRGTVADADLKGLEGWDRARVPERADQWPVGPSGAWHVSDDGSRRGEGSRSEVSRRPEPSRWLPEPDVGRVAHGIPRRMDRLRCLGNAVVPQVVEVIGRAIVEAHERIAA